MNKAVRAIGSFAVTTISQTLGQNCAQAKATGSYRSVKVVSWKYPTPADALKPWEGTPEGDEILDMVLDPKNPLGKAKFAPRATEKVDASRIFKSKDRM